MYMLDIMIQITYKWYMSWSLEDTWEVLTFLGFQGSRIDYLANKFAWPLDSSYIREVLGTIHYQAKTTKLVGLVMDKNQVFLEKVGRPWVQKPGMVVET